MTRPNPVVGIMAKFANGNRRCSHEANIPEFLCDNQVVTITGKEWLYLRFFKTVSSLLCHNSFNGIVNGCIPGIKTHIWFDLRKNLFSHLFNFFNKGDFEARSR